MTAVIIGAGVVGLSVALRLQQSGIPVTIIAATFPTPSETVDGPSEINYASQWAGAHNRFIPPRTALDARDHDMALATYRHMDATARDAPDAGITFLRGIEYLEDGVVGYEGLDETRAKELGYEEFRVLEKGELPEGVARGFEYRTWCVNPMVYCSYLLRRLSIGGCRFIRKELRSPQEVFALKNLEDVKNVINCSGVGFGDENIFVTRGQTCLVANPCDATVTRQNEDGTWFFCIPRNFHGGTIIGGTKEVDDWSADPSPETRARLLANLAATHPAILGEAGEAGEFRVMRDIVGRRPTRKGGMRLEREDVGGGRTVVHAYGLGGRGYEMAWGVAEGVMGLLGDPVAKL